MAEGSVGQEEHRDDIFHRAHQLYTEIVQEIKAHTSLGRSRQEEKHSDNDQEDDLGEALEEKLSVSEEVENKPPPPRIHRPPRLTLVEVEKGAKKIYFDLMKNVLFKANIEKVRKLHMDSMNTALRFMICECGSVDAAVDCFRDCMLSFNAIMDLQEKCILK